MKFEVTVSLKDWILDPEGRAICDTLKETRCAALRSIRTSKRYLIELEGATPEAYSIVKEIAQKHLSNPIAETFKVTAIGSE